jgi:hypothetical protein
MLFLLFFVLSRLLIVDEYIGSFSQIDVITLVVPNLDSFPALRVTGL